MDNQTAVEKVVQVGECGIIQGEMPAEGEYFRMLHEGRILECIAMSYTPDGRLAVFIPEPDSERGSLVWLVLEATI